MYRNNLLKYSHLLSKWQRTIVRSFGAQSTTQAARLFNSSTLLIFFFVAFLLSAMYRNRTKQHSLTLFFGQKAKRSENEYSTEFCFSLDSVVNCEKILFFFFRLRALLVEHSSDVRPNMAIVRAVNYLAIATNETKLYRMKCDWRQQGQK